jgi:3-oxoacyl-[acyl-carrier-protein] synthase II
LVLESAEKAITRGAHIYAEILGAATSCDAKGLYQIDRTGESGARAIHSLLRKYNLAPTDIDYICANANSSPTFDRKELQVLTKAFGEFAPRIAISSIKGVLGHPFGASGAFQTAAAALSICNGQIPANHNLEAPEIDCELDLVRDSPRNARLGHVLVTSYGYGGLNSYLLLGRYEP